MSNLITPMLTAMDRSVEYYPQIHCTVINNAKDHSVCMNDGSNWDDLEHLVSGSSTIYATSTPIKSAKNFQKSVFSNNSSIVNQNAVSCKSNDKSSKSDKQSRLFSTDNENNWPSIKYECHVDRKTTINVNMAYNGSSLESMVSNKNSKDVKDIDSIKEQINEDNYACVRNENKVISKTNSPTASPDIYQIKTFKNGAKTGHSRQWGSCGSAVTLRLLNTDAKFKDDDFHKMSFDDNFRKYLDFESDNNAKNRSYFKNSNNLKRISQVSFEAEFDSDGRIHDQVTLNLRKIDPYIIAGQITLIELSLFKALKSDEFLSFKWTGNSKNIYAPGIVASTKWFNQLNFWAQKMILECPEVHKRADMMGYFIRILKKLVDNFNNLSSGMAIMCALQVECIHRLKQTWGYLSNRDKTTFKRMEELFSGNDNYENLRQHITSLKLPCIPYIGLYLTDLTYINTAHAKFSEFESQTKTDQINNILRIVSEFQQSQYDIIENKTIIRYLESQRYIEELQKIIEDGNYRLSLSLEPSAHIEPNAQSTMTISPIVAASGPGVSNNSGIVATANLTSNITSSNVISTQKGHYKCLSNGSMCVSPQKTPPSFTCQHVTNLQVPITPKLINAAAEDTNISLSVTKKEKETQDSASQNYNIPETISSVSNVNSNQISHTLDNSSEDTNENKDSTTETAFEKENSTNRNQSLDAAENTNSNFNEVKQNISYEKAGEHSSNDSVEMSLLCGTMGKKSKRNRKERRSLIFKRRRGNSNVAVNGSVAEGQKSFVNKQSLDCADVTSLTTGQKGDTKSSLDSTGAIGGSCDLIGPKMHSLSLLDDSYLDCTAASASTTTAVSNSSINPTSSGSCSATLDNKCIKGNQQQHHLSSQILGASGPTVTSHPGSVLSNVNSKSNTLSSTNEQILKETFCAPPVIRCKIKKNHFDLKPKASSKRNTALLNLVNVANAAQTANKLSVKIIQKYQKYHKRHSIAEHNAFSSNRISTDSNENEDNHDVAEEDITLEADEDKTICQNVSSDPADFEENCNRISGVSLEAASTVPLHLVQQGMLTRKACKKTGRSALLSRWSKYWVILLESEDGSAGYLVYFVSDGKEGKPIFRTGKCYVQDLHEVNIYLTPSSPGTSNVNQKQKSEQKLNRVVQTPNTSPKNEFYLEDCEYGTIYKFRPVNSSLPETILNSDAIDRSFKYSSNIDIWYQVLSETIRKIKNQPKNERDLILLNDT